MMGSSHLDHFHQEELHGFASLATVPAFHYLACSREWNQNQLLSPMIQDMGCHWACNDQEGFVNQLPAYQLNLAKAKEELTDNSFRKLNGFFKDHSDQDHQPHEKLFMRALASDCQMDGLRPLPGNLPENSSFDSYEGGHVALPTANFSQSCPLRPGMMDDVHALDLSASAGLGGGVSFCQPSLAGMALLGGEDASSGLDHLQESIQGPFYLHHKMPSLVSGGTEARRCNSSWEHKSCQAAPGNPRFQQQRSSCSPFKVRKEKLGDRIAALQQLVAPFGKTDTASVLMEAIGYIKFLLDQVEKLSVPYMRSSGSKKRSRTTQEASNEEAKRDLRSRGLCLVPLACTSYMTTTEQGVWSAATYGGSD
ncbi:transcription factor bHLH110-like isoform X2 [Musa acuminata AAA Group]|uniref:transcription factor bHLH110-like isoform X2 n=1 Tax=Musa acuminata AAA Group TaxID=214697 RepID=UPI0031E00E64